MPRNGSGTYTLPQPAFVPGTTISSTAMNSDLSDIAAALTGSMAADGQTAFTGSFKVNDGSAAAPAYTFTAAQNTGIFRNSSGINFAIGGATIITITTSGITGPGGVSFIPIGSVNDFAGTTAPSGWLLCDGSAVSRTTYAALFTVISTTYGPGNGTTTFNIPDLRGRMLAGRDDMGGSAAGRITNSGSGIVGTTVGANGGAESVTLSSSQIPSHTHTGSGTTGTESATHTHTQVASASVGQYTAGGSNGPLGSGSQTGTESATHTHNISFTTDATGGGALHTNMPPAMIMNKIIYAGV